MPAAKDHALRSLVPLNVVIISDEKRTKPHLDLAPIRKAVHRAFEGGVPSADEAYLTVGEDLHVPVLTAWFQDNPQAARDIIGRARRAALHTIVVALIAEPFGPTSTYSDYLSELDKQATDRSNFTDEPYNACAPEPRRQPRLLLVPIVLRERLWSGNIQSLSYQLLAESALRPVFAAAHILAAAWRITGVEERLRIFISHAKLDGLPLAESFRHHLGQLHGLEKFYDTADILPGVDWRTALRQGIEASAVVALRTNIYEDRPWCTQELDWAEDFGSPLVVVDARTQLVRARETLPITGAPCIHVPDVNLVRILHAVLREALRVRLFVRQVKSLEERGLLGPCESLRVPRSTLATLGLRCARERARRDLHSAPTPCPAVRYVFVPEHFREAHRPLAETIVKAYFPDAKVCTPGDFARDYVKNA